MGTNRTRKRAAGHEPTSPSNPEISTKRERKRAADRLAQQEHRKRQRQYVEGLEAKLDFMVNTSSSGTIAKLVRENAALSEELQRLKNFYEGVQELVHKQGPTSIRCFSDQRHAWQAPDGVGAGKQHNVPASDTDAQSNASLSQLRNAKVPHAPESADLELEHLNSAQHEFVVMLEGGADKSPSTTDILHSVDLGPLPDPRVNQPIQHIFSTLDHAEEQHARARVAAVDGTGMYMSYTPRTPLSFSGLDMNSPWPELLPLYTMPNQFLSCRDSSRGFAVDNGSMFVMGQQPLNVSRGAHRSLRHALPQLPPHLCLPVSSGYVLPTDASLLEFLQLPEQEMRRLTGNRIPKPTIRDFLLNSAHNPLSTKIKAYIAPMTKSLKLSETLASYWIITLFTRWYIQKDEESFNDMPPWLRPTDLQRTMMHPMALWFMPWPELRDEAINDAISDPQSVQGVMETLGLYMEVDLSGNACGSGESMQYVDGPDAAGRQDDNPNEAINESVRDLQNWRLRDGFFARYPRWRALHPQPLDRLPA